MSDRERQLLDELVAEGERLDADRVEVRPEPGIMVPGGMDVANPNGYREWHVRTLAFLERVWGRGSVFHDKFRSLEPFECGFDNLGEHLAILRAVQKDVVHMGADADAAAEPERMAPTTCSRVFIIHGHDLSAALELQNLIRDRFKPLAPVLLKEQPTKGRFIGEKFETEAGQCGFAFAILSPDDIVEVKDTGETYNQMRPNVIYELGWFHGKLGRSRTCIICKHGTKLPSDLEGIGRCQYMHLVGETYLDIERELKEAYEDVL